jgi:hypothetical protein
MNNTVSQGQSYFFKSESETLFVDEYQKRVGILNRNPQYTLDIAGDMYAVDVSACNVVATNVLGDNGDVTNIVGSNLSYSNIEGYNLNATNIISASNFTSYLEGNVANIDEIQCVNLTAASNVYAGSNLALLNTWINQECPIPSQGSLFGFSLGGGWIDPSWLKVDNDFMETLDSLWNLAQTGFDLFNLVQGLVKPDGGLADDLKDKLKDALEGGGSNADKIYVAWENVKKKGIYVNGTTGDVGVKGGLYLNEAQSIYSLPSLNYYTGYELNLDIASTTGADKLIDVGTKEAYLNTLNIGSNVYMSVNSNAIRLHNFRLTSNAITNSNTSMKFLNSNIIEIQDLHTSNLTSSNVTTNIAQVGNFYVSTNGLYYGNPNNPFSSYQVLDGQGYYKLSIPKSQITDLEALNIQKLADGVLEWTGFNSSIAPYIDPFQMSSIPPLFVVT